MKHQSFLIQTAMLGAAVMLYLGLSNSEVLAQGLPSKQPKLLHIMQEDVKVGAIGDHARHETGWPKAFEKAKSTDYYLALTSVTGPNMAWYLLPWDSYSAIGKSMQRDEKDPVLSAELDRLAKADAEFVSAVRTVELMARPDLSVGEFPNLGKVRFYAISTIKIRPGFDSQFEEASKVYAAALKRVSSQVSYRAYQVTSGLSGSTYYFMTSVEDYARFDKITSDDDAMWKSLSKEELNTLEKCAREVFLETAEYKFRVDPTQSYVPAETRQSDPEFWSAK